MHFSSICVRYITFHRLVCDMGDSPGLWQVSLGEKLESGGPVLLGSYGFMVPELSGSHFSRVISSP